MPRFPSVRVTTGQLRVHGARGEIQIFDFNHSVFAATPASLSPMLLFWIEVLPFHQFLLTFARISFHRQDTSYILCVTHLWLLAVSALSVCPLGSSISLFISLSWRALRLLSRAASSSSSSFLASLKSRDVNGAEMRDLFSVFSPASAI